VALCLWGTHKDKVILIQCIARGCFPSADLFMHLTPPSLRIRNVSRRHGLLVLECRRSPGGDASAADGRRWLPAPPPAPRTANVGATHAAAGAMYVGRRRDARRLLAPRSRHTAGWLPASQDFIAGWWAGWRLQKVRTSGKGFVAGRNEFSQKIRPLEMVYTSGLNERAETGSKTQPNAERIRDSFGLRELKRSHGPTQHL